MNKFIKLTKILNVTNRKTKPVFININHITNFYKVSDGSSNIFVTSGDVINVLESIDDILKSIEESNNE